MMQEINVTNKTIKEVINELENKNVNEIKNILRCPLDDSCKLAFESTLEAV